jgi:bacteriorhodopsin
MLCFCIICACQALYFAYHSIPRADTRKRSTWDFVWIPLMESIVYGLFSTSSQVGYIRLYDGHAIVWLRSAQWLLTVPVLLMQISKMSILEVQGVDMNSMMTAVGVLMIVLGFSASLATDAGIKWMFFCFGLLCMIFLFVVVWRIMGGAITYYISLCNEEGVHTANRIRLMAVVFFLSWSFFPLFYLLSIEGTCVVGESITTVCLTVLDCFAKNIFNILLWHTLWNSRGGLNGRWTSNSHLMAREMDALPDKELDDHDLSHEDSIPHVDEEAPRHLEADVVVRPGSVAASQRRSRVRSQTGSAAPMEPQYAKAHASQQKHLSNGQGDIELSVGQINGSMPTQVCLPYPRGLSFDARWLLIFRRAP